MNLSNNLVPSIGKDYQVYTILFEGYVTDLFEIYSKSINVMFSADNIKEVHASLNIDKDIISTKNAGKRFIVSPIYTSKDWASINDKRLKLHSILKY